jgi:hypothetical protein
MTESVTHFERPGVVQRAFQIAKSGTAKDIAALNAQLAAEGYENSTQALAGRSILQKLTRMIGEAAITAKQRAS